MSQTTPMQAARPAKIHDRLRLQVGAILAFCLALLTLAALPVLLAIAVWLPPALLGAAAVLALPAAWWARRRPRRGVWPWVRVTLLTYGLASVATAAPIYYLAVVTWLKPPIQPQVVLSNGDRTLTFQGMMHVGTDAFFRSIVFDAGKALMEGSVIYYEGVLPDERADAWLSEYLGTGEDLARAYEQLASTCGLVFQASYFEPLEIDRRLHPERHVAADVSSQALRQEFDRLLATDMSFVEAMQDREATRSVPSIGNQRLAAFVAWQRRGDERQQAVAGTVCRGLLTLLLRPRSAKARPRDPFDAVTIDFRNRQLVQRLLADPHDKIFLTYGSDHLPGVYALLKQADPRWRVESVKWMRSVAPPEHLNGKLDLEP
ncbi:hypothetical protein [Pelomonas cellulosilytica]|uniref:TraB/GumN family protein n=1 Tax=Pelomonas cellulosilytica TaxID=2906762 RepID=A0ABS8XTC5_9BURK|nr:hypothetical protein [Pelomonas sp. P8]MCE4555947.1 hypothetical protein [Pelomonas sp. P8]